MIAVLDIISLLVSLGCASFVAAVFWLWRPSAGGVGVTRAEPSMRTVDVAAGEPVVYLTAAEVEALYHRGVLVLQQAAGNA